MPEAGRGLRPALGRTLPWAGLATLGLVAGLVLRSSQVTLILHLYIGLIGLLAATTLVIALLEDAPAAGAGMAGGGRLGLRRRRRAAPRLQSLEEIEHAADFSLSSAFDLHFRLRPHLRRVAAHRLANRGIELDSQPERAAQALGPLAWELIRPEREAPPDRHARGITLAELRALVDALEAV